MNSDVAAREVAIEQDYVDTVYSQMEKAALSAQALATEGLARGRIGNEGGLVERDLGALIHGVGGRDDGALGVDVEPGRGPSRLPHLKARH